MDVVLRRWAPVLLVALALAAAGWAAAGGTGLSSGTRPPAEQEPPSGQPEPTPDQPTPTGEEEAAGELSGVEIPSWLGAAMTGLLIAVVAIIVGVFLYVGLRYLLFERVARRAILDQAASQPPDATADLAEVREAVRAGLSDIDAGGDPRRAVIACWLRLERLAAAAGTARLAADTPTDLVRRLLARHRVSEAALGRLAGAYRQARYAPAEVAGDLLETARQALHDIDSQLAAGAGSRR
jgi:Domain of unknown function (DUF4129)